MNSGTVDTVIVDGKLLMRGKQVLCVDEEALLAEARQVCAAVQAGGRCGGSVSSYNGCARCCTARTIVVQMILWSRGFSRWRPLPSETG